MSSHTPRNDLLRIQFSQTCFQTSRVPATAQQFPRAHIQRRNLEFLRTAPAASRWHCRAVLRRLEGASQSKMLSGSQVPGSRSSDDGRQRKAALPMAASPGSPPSLAKDVSLSMLLLEKSRHDRASRGNAITEA